MYAKGEGVPQDGKEAVKWYRKSAEQGNANAQYNLGLMYQSGGGGLQDPIFGEILDLKGAMTQDRVKAYAWFNLSSANGFEDASEQRDRIAKSMRPDQIAEGQKLSREWFEKYQPKE